MKRSPSDMYNWLPGIVSFLVAFATVPFIRRFALQWKFVDMPNSRKIHRDPLPLLGGVAIFAGFIIASALSYSLQPAVPSAYIGVLAGAAILFSIGLVDDYHK